MVMGRGSLIFFCACMALTSCDKDEATAEPGGAGGATGQDEGLPPPTGPGGQIQMEYGHKEDPGKDRHAKKDDEDDDEEDDALPEGAIGEASAVRQLAEAAVDENVEDAYAQRVLSPAVPDDWPPASKSLVYFVYPIAVAESGGTKLKSPSLKVSVDVTNSKVNVEKLGGGKVLGPLKEDRDSRTLMHEVEKAEQGLVDLLHGKQDAKHIAHKFRAYRDWFEHHHKLEKDLKARNKHFFSWVDSQP